MQTKLANDSSPERYVVEIDGITKSEYSVFVKALTASLQLKQEFPHSSVKLRAADDGSEIHFPAIRAWTKVGSWALLA